MTLDELEILSTDIANKLFDKLKDKIKIKKCHLNKIEYTTTRGDIHTDTHTDTHTDIHTDTTCDHTRTCGGCKYYY